MAKNDFDIDFDFEEEYGFDPKAVLGSEFEDDDLDFSDLDDIDLGMDASEPKEEEPDYSDFDVDSLDLDELKLDEDVPAMEAAPSDIPEEPSETEKEALFGVDDFDEDYDPDDEDLMDFSRRTNFFDAPKAPVEAEPAPAYEETPYEQDAVQEEISQQLQQMQEEDDLEDEDDEPDTEAEAEDVPRRRPSERKKREPIKITVPPAVMKIVSLYIPPNPKEAFNPQPDPNNPRRRRKKSKLQIFKEAYLPTVLACLSLVLILVFCAGAIGNAIDRKRVNDKAALESEQAAASEAERVAQEAEAIMDQAEVMAAGYNYEGAIGLLDSFSGKIEDYPDMVTMKSEFVDAQSKLVEWRDPNSIPNLAFHVLIADPARAFADQQYGGKYNRNFVTIAEFSKILEQLYINGYVLVDFDSFTDNSSGLNGYESISAKTIYLPEGKKPVMITETMVNYFTYMTDSNGDGAPDAGGDGFASKLVVDAAGNVKAEYIDASGQTHVGDYDLVPILETFIKTHPDFVYRDARATLAVCGYDGIFGYRINTSVISTKGNDYYNEQVAGATQVVNALRSHGYTLACYTFDNIPYGQKNANQISEDLKYWTNQITPVLGNVDVLVYAQTSDIGDYTGNKYTVLHNAGFRYFVSNADVASTTVSSDYVHQKRLMVTGENMAWKATSFADIFDCNVVLDLATRGGSVPH